ncbi:hypothetical protein KUTeg_023840 [Tegillarca granosa]|uniref:Uncharacterized protein n=1 Tax=Tegillarca granosa TaxID=220873 RepID=A0ABQ9E3R1_TEGGR|nr:hypothetical protein KUTeg_023840 [Tegillarca granosa]
MDFGVPCVTMDGEILMLRLFANNSDLDLALRKRMLILEKARASSGWTTLVATAVSLK